MNTQTKQQNAEAQQAKKNLDKNIFEKKIIKNIPKPCPLPQEFKVLF